jgi:hypothetical protein
VKDGSVGGAGETVVTGALIGKPPLKGCVVVVVVVPYWIREPGTAVQVVAVNILPAIALATVHI